MGMRGAFRIAACVHMSLRRGATVGNIGTLTLITLSSPAKLKGHVQSPTADYSATLTREYAGMSSMTLKVLD